MQFIINATQKESLKLAYTCQVSVKNKIRHPFGPQRKYCHSAKRHYSKVKLRWICIAHRRKHALAALPLPHKSALISASQYVQPGTSTTPRDHGYGLVYHAMCLFTPQVLPGTRSHSSLPYKQANTVRLP